MNFKNVQKTTPIPYERLPFNKDPKLLPKAVAKNQIIRNNVTKDIKQ